MTSICRRRAAPTAGAIVVCSSVPISPPSPACGFRPQTATRARGSPRSLQACAASSMTISIFGCVRWSETSLSGKWLTQEEPSRFILAGVGLQGELQSQLLVEAARVLGVADQQIARIVRLRFESESFECDFRADARNVAQ